MWLKNDVLGVFFDERKGGMPVRDSFGFINAVAVEIACALPPPFYQSLNDRRPHIEKHGNSVVASGIMQKGGRATSHTYEMAATLEENKLSLAYRLNVTKTERVITSKMWLWTKLFQRCTISEEGTFDVRGTPSGWYCLYSGEQLRSVTLSNSGGELRVLGSTTPSVYTRVLRYRHEKMEVVYGWAEKLLQKGTYSGDFTLVYPRRAQGKN